MSPPILRRATPEDAALVLDLSETAAHGLLARIFRQMNPDCSDLRVYMLSRVRDGHSKISHAKCWIAECDGVPAGLINLDPVADPPEPLTPDTPPLFRPLAELEALAPGTVVIEFLAVLAAARGRGVASALLAKARQLRGPNGLSLVVSDDNTPARRLYARSGFIEVARRPIVKDDWDSPGTDWILMRHP